MTQRGGAHVAPLMPCAVPRPRHHEPRRGDATMMGLRIDGNRPEDDNVLRYRGDDYRVQIDGPAADGSVPEAECAACGWEGPTEDLDDDGTGDGRMCPECGEVDDLHIPEADPEDWCNSASITVDPGEDSVTCTISVGDPRGAFTFQIRRLPEGSDNAGKLLMHLPHAGMSMAHAPLTPLHAGTLGIGHEWSEEAAKRVRTLEERAEAIRDALNGGYDGFGRATLERMRDDILREIEDLARG